MIDASAVLAWLRDEPGADTVARRLDGSFLSAVNLSEVLQKHLAVGALLAVPLVLTAADSGRVVASGTVPVGALPAGDYIVRGVVRLESGETGRVLRTLRKLAR